ncbi:MAG: prephenate dehydrogenase [Clostridia bacterium]|nr:prephenate dehydrogenase [Clostridia bacterium]
MRIGIVGLGLIGASMAKALTRLEHRVLGMDRDESTLKYALLTGTVAEKLTEENLPSCDLLLLAVYPQAAVEILTRWAPRISRSTLVMDLCGVKRAVCEPCFALAEKYGFPFMGGHPMAGRQFSGIKYADADLFQGASMVLVPREGEDLFRVSGVSELMHRVGFAAVTVTTPEEHDRMIAYTSQLAHLVSNAYVLSPAAKGLRYFAGGSYRDLTRVAFLNEQMWTELFLENGDLLGEELDRLLNRLTEFRDSLRQGDEERLKALLREGRERKEELDAEWKS